jgi:enoyl-CoA hydratase/carnithine racemase
LLPEEMLALLDRWTVPNSVSAIVITFEGTTIFVFHDDLDRLKTLENALSLGGSAVGMLGTIHNGDRIYSYRKPYGDDDYLLQKCQQ